jgi:hypothetical protein
MNEAASIVGSPRSWPGFTSIVGSGFSRTEEQVSPPDVIGIGSA